MKFDELPRHWQIHIKDLRAENARYRVKNAELRAQQEELAEAGRSAE